MPLANTSRQFGSLTKFLHWTIFILFCAQYFLINRRDYFPKGDSRIIEYTLLHKSIGILLLALAVVFILWRHAGTRPKLPGSSPRWQILLARVTHSLLYIVLLLMPFSGIMMSMFSGYGASFFGLDLPMLFDENKAISGFFHEMHEIMAWIIIALVGLHIVGALYHHFKLKDNVLKRMLPFAKPD